LVARAIGHRRCHGQGAVRILLTGGSGFIGRCILQRLGERYEILAPSHAELELTDAEGVATWLNTNKVDAVIHAAVRPGHRNAVDPTRQLEINLRMYANLVRCRDSWGRLLYLSSGAVYGTQEPVVRAREDDVGRVVPADDHGLSRYVIAGLAAGDERVVELRPFGVFGPHEDYAIRFISNAICKTLFDLPVSLRQDRRFSYLWIDDLMPVLEHFLEGGTLGSAFNVTPDGVEALRDLADLVVAVSGKDLPVNVAQEGMGLTYTGDNTRLKDEVPRLSFTPIASAVERLYDWYARRKELVRYERLLVDK
jgi:UDP-glucose 4-epimerase